jgi:hypothetical protein
MDEELQRINSLYKERDRPIVQVYGFLDGEPVQSVSGIPVLYDTPLFDEPDDDEPDISDILAAMCSGEVDARHISAVLEDVAFVLFLFDGSPKKLVGFACVDIFSRSELNIDPLCAIPNKKGYGTLLIDSIVSLAGAYIGVKRIRLESVHSAIPFYQKNAFRLDSPIDPYGQTPMSRVVGGRRKKTRRKKKITR